MAKSVSSEQEELLIRALQEIHGGRELEAFFFGDHARGSGVQPKKLPLLLAFLEILRVQHSRFHWAPRSPVPVASRILFQTVAKHLHRLVLKQQLKLYVSVGTSLDWHHHMDAVFASGGRFVGIDITTEDQVERLDMKDAIIAASQLPIVLIPRNELAVVGGFETFGRRIADRLLSEISQSQISVAQQCWFAAKNQVEGF